MGTCLMRTAKERYMVYKRLLVVEAICLVLIAVIFIKKLVTGDPFNSTNLTAVALMVTYSSLFVCNMKKAKQDMEEENTMNEQ